MGITKLLMFLFGATFSQSNDISVKSRELMAGDFGWSYYALQTDVEISKYDSRVNRCNSFNIPPSWVKVGKPNGSMHLDFSLLLPQHNISYIEKLLVERSDPRSNTYGQWLSKKQIDIIVGSDTKHFEVVGDWLINTISHVNCNYTADSMYCRTNISNINKLFETEILEYRDSISNVRFYSGREKGYSIPLYLNNIIELVIGIGDFPELTHKNMKTKKVRDDTYYISPASLRALYNVSSHVHPASSLSSQTVVEFQNDDCFNKADLDQFLNDSGLPAVNISKSNILGDAGCDMSTPYPDIEATLDIQYQLGVNPLAVEYYVSVSDWLYQYANTLYNSTSPPLVNSMSYGWAEKDQCDPMVFPECYIGGDAEVYAKRTNAEFMKLSLRGITLLASSGDAGAPGRTNEGCDISSPLNPVFPTSSPYVLSVGGSIVMNPVLLNVSSSSHLCTANKCIGGGSELNCNLDRCGWTSGGGFSDFFNRPWWQENASNHYLNSGVQMPPEKYFNKLGRVYPDVTLVAHNYLIMNGGQYMAVDGTSASSPSVSGLIAILNALRLSQNKSSLGLVAPLLYNIAENCQECFKDVVLGSNNSTEMADCEYGYTATKGFDAVYGLGLPNFDKIYNYVKLLK